MTQEPSAANAILSDSVVFQKYARYLPEKGRRELWGEIVERNKSMHRRRFPQLGSEIDTHYEHVFKKQVLPSMRSMQFGGRAIEVNHTRMYNCAYLPLDTINSFSEALFLLLGGTGVGYSVQSHHVKKLPHVTAPSSAVVYQVQDSIEGWADALLVLMSAYLDERQDARPLFDFSLVRPKGAPLKTAGGEAPGPEPLQRSLEKVEQLLQSCPSGTQLRPIDCHDIMCHVADCVVAGGIRRSALLALFSHDDTEMMNCKVGEWWVDNPQRARANNSASLKRKSIALEQFQQLWQAVENSGAGEPGFYFTNNRDWGVNPCCVSGDTVVQTKSGPRSVRSLVGVKFQATVRGKHYAVESDGFFESGKKSVFLVVSEGGRSVKTTADHRFLVRREERIDAAEFSSDRVAQYIGKKELAMECVRSDHGEQLVVSYAEWVELQHLDNDSVLLMSNGEDDRIASIEPCGEETVYDVTVHDVHEFDGNGFRLHNCEIALRPYQFCNLVDVNATAIDTQEELNARVKAAAFIGTLQATYTDFHYLRPIWRRTTERDALLGIGMTGIASGSVLELNLREAAEVAKAENSRVAAILGINEAARVTTVKPSGTSSLVLGCSSGIHAWHSPYYIRRVRVGKNEAYYRYMRENFPELVEDDLFSPNQAVVSFPVKAPDGAVFRDEKVDDLLARIFRFNTEWVAAGHRRGDNQHNVSATISVKPDEWQMVGEWIWQHRNSFNGLSVLPYDGGTYQQAPFEDCDAETYKRMVEQLRGFDIAQIKESADYTNPLAEGACTGDKCEYTPKTQSPSQ